jgi:tRNA A-37 threonylcarbamoyl transferase component Bud32
MISSHMFFCPECGAANSNDASICFVCHEPLIHPDEQDLPAHPDSSLEVQASAQAYQVQLISAALPVLSGPLQPGALLKERYRIIGQAGQGGYGVVYKASDTRKRNRLVAIKQIDLSALTTRQIIEATDSFNREVQMLSRLRHKNLPRVYEHFTDPHHWYVVMDYIEGETLEDYLARKNEPLPAREATRIGIQLTKVLGYLHSQHPPIIFRDVKPANIMRTPRGRLYLIDFGIARLFNPQKTRDTGPLGSPGFAAPEQYGRAQSTVQTDIYGLGATLQALLQSPDIADPSDQDQDAPVNETPGELANESQGTRQSIPAKRAIPRRLRKLLDQMLEYDAAKRPKHMQEVQRRLELMPFNIPLFLLTLLRGSFWGLVIGSIPYSFILLLLLSSVVPVLGTALAWCAFVLSAISFAVWPAVLGLQLLTALALLRSKRHWLMGAGILFMLAALFLAAAFGLIPWLWNGFFPIERWIWS